MADQQTRRDVLRGLGAGTTGLALSGLATTASAGTRSCPKTKGYWKNHTDQWVDGDGDPLETLWIDGDFVPTVPEFAGGEDELTVLDILREPPRGDKSVIVLHQRIAAQLNYWTSTTCEESDEAFARATAWLWALDDPVVDGNASVGANQWAWDVEVPETTVETSTVDVTVPAGTYGEAVKDALQRYNEGDTCECSPTE